MARPKDIGTAAETAVVRYLQANGFPNAERRALRGTYDCGDVTGTPGVVWEVKGGKAAEKAASKQITAWVQETETERGNANAAVGVLVKKRAGIGPSRADQWDAIIPARTWAQLLGIGPIDGVWDWELRVSLGIMTALLRRAGYGDPA